jgi:hypothetical protein
MHFFKNYILAASWCPNIFGASLPFFWRCCPGMKVYLSNFARVGKNLPLASLSYLLPIYIHVLIRRMLMKIVIF